jgi:TRAP-type C4-dicarboxylate transport system permease small subunit
MSRFDRAVAPALGLIAAALLFGLMLLTCVDVVGRYFFNRPVTGGFEMTELLLAALIFAGLPLVTLRSEHIVVDLLDPVTPDRLFRIQHALATLIGAICTGYLAWRLGLRAEELASRGETTSQLGFRLAWLTWAMSLLMALTALALVAVMFRPQQRHFPGDEQGPGA